MDVNDCFEQRILRKVRKDMEKVKSSLKIAEMKLEEAKKLFSADFFNHAVLSAYTSMFHAARSLLYSEGIQEKSHYAVYIYLNEKGSGRISKRLLNSFNSLRENRHEILYGFEDNNSKDDAENAVLDAEDFLIEVKKTFEKDGEF